MREIEPKKNHLFAGWRKAAVDEIHLFTHVNNLLKIYIGLRNPFY